MGHGGKKRKACRWSMDLNGSLDSLQVFQARELSGPAYSESWAMRRSERRRYKRPAECEHKRQSKSSSEMKLNNGLPKQKYMQHVNYRSGHLTTVLLIYASRVKNNPSHRVHEATPKVPLFWLWILDIKKKNGCIVSFEMTAIMTNAYPQFVHPKTWCLTLSMPSVSYSKSLNHRIIFFSIGQIWKDVTSLQPTWLGKQTTTAFFSYVASIKSEEAKTNLGDKSLRKRDTTAICPTWPSWEPTAAAVFEICQTS